jgi:8-oxo-dGTP diphosphatase
MAGSRDTDKTGKYYSGYSKIFVAIDCIIFGFINNDLNILLFKRDIEPEKGKLSLIGGFVQEKESLEDAAQRILLNLTGIKDVFLEQLFAFGGTERDPGERVISVAYYALLKAQDLDTEHVELHGARWCPVSDSPDLIFDHKEMRDKALLRLQRIAKSRPIGFELLPRKFTIPQLQSLYEAIYQKKFDNRNFRKKLLTMNILEQLGVKDKTSSKKGAYLYRFDKEKYDRFLNEGFLFSL